MVALSERDLLRRGIIRRPQNGDVGIGSQQITTSEDRALSFLNVLVDEYNTSPQAQALVKPGSYGQRRGPITEFNNSQSFSEAYAIAANRVDRFNSEEYERWFPGHLFSHFAWRELASIASHDQIILPESYMPELFRQVGDVKTIDNGHGVEMGDHAYLPDGVLIADGRVKEMYEYTLSKDYFKFVNQVHGFRFAKQALSEICDKAVELVFVVPSASKEELAELEGAVTRKIKNGSESVPKFSIKPLSITYGEFVGFAARTLRSYKPKGENQSLMKRVKERERILSGVNISNQVRRQELARQLESVFENQDSESVRYVLAHGPKHEKPLTTTRNTGVITIPRLSSRSLGEPAFFRK